MKALSNSDFDTMLLDVIACKWSVCLLDAISRGITRPGAIQRECDQISTKVMNQSLNRLVEYGILQKSEFNEAVKRVEYALTELGQDSISLFALAKEIRLKHCSND